MQVVFLSSSTHWINWTPFRGFNFCRLNFYQIKLLCFQYKHLQLPCYQVKITTNKLYLKVSVSVQRVGASDDLGHNTLGIPVKTLVKVAILSAPLIVVKAHSLRRYFDEALNTHFLSQQFWHDKDPYRLKGLKHLAKAKCSRSTVKATSECNYVLMINILTNSKNTQPKWYISIDAMSEEFFHDIYGHFVTS